MRMRSHLGLHRNANSCRQNALGLGRTVDSQIVEFQYKAPQIQGSLFFSFCYILTGHPLSQKVEFHP